MARYGFTDAEFERAKAEYISYIESAANKADTRRNAEFIRPILSNFFDQQPILEPQDELDMTNLIFDQVLTAQVVNQLAMQLITPNNLVVVYDGPEKDGIATPTEAQLLAIIEEVNASQIDAPAGEDIPDALLDPSTLRGSKIRKTGSTIYGATTWVLKNGLTVVVYPTDLTRDQIIFDLYKDGGESLISTDDIATFDSSIFSQYVSNTGVAGFSGTTLSKMLTGKNVRVTPYINSLEHGIRGNSTVRDLETAFQLMYLSPSPASTLRNGTTASRPSPPTCRT